MGTINNCILEEGAISVGIEEAVSWRCNQYSTPVIWLFILPIILNHECGLFGQLTDTNKQCSRFESMKPTSQTVDQNSDFNRINFHFLNGVACFAKYNFFWLIGQADSDSVGRVLLPR
jgi:hypothetical protein